MELWFMYDSRYNNMFKIIDLRGWYIHVSRMADVYFFGEQMADIYLDTIISLLEIQTTFKNRMLKMFEVQ